MLDHSSRPIPTHLDSMEETTSSLIRAGIGFLISATLLVIVMTGVAAL